MKGDVFIKEFLQYVIDHKDYESLYNSLVATGALLVSIISFVINTIVTKMSVQKEKARYEEQQKQYEERLSEERTRREEDKKIADDRARISEQPYLVFKKAEKIKVVPSASGTQIVFSMSFQNKGRGSAYSIVPDTNCTANYLGDTFMVYRYDAVKDPIAMVNEFFVMEWYYVGKEIYKYRMPFSICYEDASGRRYIQKYEVDIISENEANIITYAKPQLCD